MNRDELMQNYWNYYLLLENKFDNMLKYVMLKEDNFDTYSYELSCQLLQIGSELDVVMKGVCGFGLNERKNIADYCPEIINLFPLLKSQEVKVIGLENNIKPYETWDNSKPKELFWWKAYNDVKHARTEHMKKASLKNVVYALAGLYIMEQYWLKNITNISNEIDFPDKSSEIFSLLNWRTKYTSLKDVFLEQTEEGEVIFGG